MEGTLGSVGGDGGRPGAGSPGRTRVMVVDDEWFWADAVVHQIEAMPDAECVGVARDGLEARSLCAERRPQVALIDRVLGEDSGIRLARILSDRFPGLRAVIVTVEPTPLSIAEARDARLPGFVAKDDLLTRQEVHRVVREVAAGRRCFSDAVRRLEEQTAAADGRGLTPQEHEIVICLARCMETEDIARHLCIAEQTVRNKTRDIGEKLGVSGRLAIVMTALRERIICLPEGP